MTAIKALDISFIKRKYLKSDCETIIDISNVVRNSSANNFSKFIRDPISKKMNVKYFNWTEFLGNFFTKINGITKKNHFKLSTNFKEYCNSGSLKIKLLKSNYESNTFPHQSKPKEVIPTEMPFARQWYLFNEFNANLTRPKPQIPEPLSVISKDLNRKNKLKSIINKKVKNLK